MGSLSFKSVAFDGINDHATAGDVLDFERTDTFSISAWVRTTSSSGFDTIVSKLEGAGNFEGYELAIDSSNEEVTFQLVNLNASNKIRVDTNGSVPLTNGVWHHIVVTYDGSSAASGVTIYVDGASQSTSTVQDNLSATTLTAAPLQIGARDGTNNPFAGNIDWVSIYDKELTSGEVTTIYNNADPVDHTSVGPTGNLVGLWLMGDGDTYPTLTDNSTNSNDMTMTSMAADDIENQGAGYFTLEELAEPALVGLVDGTELPFNVYGLSGGGGPTVTQYYKMRATADPGPGYETWTVTGAADFAGASAPGAIVGGTAVVVDEWTST